MTTYFTRRTSVYVLKVPAHVEGRLLIDAMCKTADSNPDIQRTGAWVDNDTTAVLLYRAAGDTVAIKAAEQMGGNTPGATLHTGIGAHPRLVAEA